MANYFAKTRSNYFRVRDAQHFRKFCDTYGLRLIAESEGRSLQETLWGFAVEDRIPDYSLRDLEQKPNTSFVHALAEQLADGEVAVIMEVGSEKLRLLNGYACAVNHKGEKIELSLAEIYRRAKEAFGVEPTLAEFR